MANAHSHAFQRDLRGVGERPAPERTRDDFWSWREAMYALAGALDPDSMREVAARVYREMAAAGYGAVGEFHYVHHQPDGTPYDEPNALATRVAEAAPRPGCGSCCCPPPTTAPAGTARDRPPSRASGASATRTWRRSSTRVDALRAWAAGRPGVAVGVAAH